MLCSNSTKTALAAVIAAAAIGFASTPTQASITYVDANDASDATGTNTTYLNDAPFTPAAANANDDMWTERTPYGNDDQVYSSNGLGGKEDPPMLKTTVSGLTAGGSYNVYGYFLSSTSNDSNWAFKGTVDKNDINNPDGAFGSGDESLPNDPSVFFSRLGNSGTYALPNSTDAPKAVAGDFSNSVKTGGTFALYQASLGQAVADSNGDLSVYVDNYVTTTGNNRTWYDGVGYEQTSVPEPASLALLGLGGITLLSSRRRDRSA